MNWDVSFAELDKQCHDRDSFDSGEPALNQFLKQAAARHMEAGISKTLVLPTREKLANGKQAICSFYTVTAGTISRETLPQVLAKRLPQYPVPVFLLAQLAVAHEYQSMGLGKITLIKALEYLWKVHASMPAYAVIVDCLNQSAEAFYLKYGFTFLSLHQGKNRLFIPIRDLEQLFA